MSYGSTPAAFMAVEGYCADQKKVWRVIQNKYAYYDSISIGEPMEKLVGAGIQMGRTFILRGIRELWFWFQDDKGRMTKGKVIFYAWSCK